jgi:2-haloacid dehalogenase/putative hydrolase of the HAD superfamily
MTALQLDGIFLDLYGTLTAGDRAAVETVCNRIVTDADLAFSGHELSVMWGERFLNSLDECSGDRFETLFDLEIRTLRETMAHLGKTVVAETYAEQLREYWQAPPLQDDVREFFETCPVPVCIVSNADEADARAVVRRFDLPVVHVITSERSRSYKPDRRIFELALAETGWRADCVIHCGDSLHSDIGGAIAAGIRSVWLNRAHRIHDIGTHEPDHEIAKLLELTRLPH